MLKWGQGDEAALERLIPLVHQELHRIARRCMAGERADHSLQATALVNEAYLRLVDAQGRRVAGPRAFPCGVGAGDAPDPRGSRARAALPEARRPWRRRVTFDEALVVTERAGQEFVALDDALEALAKFDERKSRVIEMRFFGGLSVEETAAVLKVSADTVMRDWRLAKAWLQREMRGDRSHDA